MSAYVISPHSNSEPWLLWKPALQTTPATFSSVLINTFDSSPTTIYWGDGTSQVLNSGVATSKPQSPSSGVYTDNVNKVTKVYILSSFPPLGGTVDLSPYQYLGDIALTGLGLTQFPKYASAPYIFLLNIANNAISGPLPDTPLPTGLVQFRCQNNQITGSLPDCTNFSRITTLFASNNSLTSFSGTVPISLGTFAADGNALSSSAVNSILSAFVTAGRTSANGTCYLDLRGGTNAPPSGQGLNDKITLQNRGWTVYTN